ncbi:MAG: AAA family ATPase [Candidatus Heimdallarchaeota archaeon]
MKKFELNKIQLENIKTYTYEEIDFSKGNNVIIGENGAGKSTILESIYLSLYGEKVSGRKLVDMIRYGEQQGRILLHFSINGVKYRIDDVITKKDETNASQTQILVNETEEETVAEGKNAVSAKIEELLELDATTFINAIYASQGEIGKIVTATKGDRRKLFDRLFQIDRYDKVWNNLKHINRIVENNIGNFSLRVKDLSSDIERLPLIAKEIKEKEKLLVEEKNALKEITTNYTTIDQKYKVIKNSKEKYVILNSDIKRIKRNVSDLEVEISTQFKQIQKDVKDDTLKINEKTINELKVKLEKIDEKNKIDLVKFRDQEKETERNLSEIKGKIHTLTELNLKINDAKDQLDSEIEEKRKDLPELKIKFSTWKEQLPELLLKKQIELKELKGEKTSLDKLLEKIKTKEGKIRELHESNGRYETNIVDKRFKLIKNAGDQWEEFIQNNADLDFNQIINKIQETIETNDSEYSIKTSRKSVLETEIKKLQVDLNHLKKLDGEGTCPTCKQEISAIILIKLFDEMNQEKEGALKEKTEIGKRISALKTVQKELKDKLSDMNENKILYAKVKIIYEDLLEMESDNEKVKEEKRKATNEFEKLKDEYSDERNKELENEIDELERITLIIKQTQKSIARLEKQQAINKTDKEKAAGFEREIDKLKAKYDPKDLEKYEQQISKLEQKQTENQKIITIVTSLGKNLSELKTDNLELKSKTNEKNSIEKIDGFKERETIEEQWLGMNEKITKLKTEIKNLNIDIIPPLKEQKSILLVKQKELKKQEDNVKLEKKKLKIVTILRALMKDLPSRLLPNYINRINAKATEILQSIIPESDIQGIILNNDYSLQINRLGNYEDISVLSGGETVIIALALRLAFAMEFSSLDILILDEPTIFLDERRRGELVSVLEKERLIGQMFVVTHDQDFERIADKTHHLSKSNGETTLNPIGDEDKEKISDFVL